MDHQVFTASSQRQSYTQDETLAGVLLIHPAKGLQVIGTTGCLKTAFCLEMNPQMQSAVPSRNYFLEHKFDLGVLKWNLTKIMRTET